jgi:hypothetical protein
LSLPEAHGRFTEGLNFVSFAFNYDVTQFLAALALENFPCNPYEKVWEITRQRSFKSKKKLQGNTAVYWGPYAINYIKSKYFRLWKLRDPDNPRKPKLDKDGNLYFGRAENRKWKSIMLASFNPHPPDDALTYGARIAIRLT